MRKALLLTFALILTILAPGFATAQSYPAGSCCAVQFARCAANCQCGVFEFNCTLEYPGCHSNCVCNICP